MPGSARDLPGIRLGARVHVFLERSDEAYVTRVEDLDDDWIAISVGEAEMMAWHLGDPLDLEVPQAGGSLFIHGRLAERRTDGLLLAVVKIEHVGADPGVCDAHEQRRHVRIPLNLPLLRVAYRREEATEWLDTGAVLRDLSAGGAALQVEHDIPVAAQVRFIFPLPIDGTELRVQGLVVLSKQEHHGRWVMHRVSVEFEHLPANERNWLTRQLHRYQVRARR